jgi:chromate transporter
MSAPSTLTDPLEVLAVPSSKRELFIAFTSLSLQGFGGVLPVAQRVLVEQRRWLTREQFVEMLSVSQVLPGPNIVNLALMFGDRCFGLRGAFVALAGMLLVPMLIVLALTALYGHYADSPVVTGALRGMGAVAAGLIIATGLKLLTTIKRNPMGAPTGLAFATVTLLATAWLRWPLVWVILGLGPLAIAVAWHRLRS